MAAEAKLSDDEKRLLDLLIKGWTQERIARRLCREPKWVYKTLARLRDAYNLTTLVDIGLWYAEYHLDAAAKRELGGVELVLSATGKLGQKALLEWCASPKGRRQSLAQIARHFKVSERTVRRAFVAIADSAKISQQMVVVVMAYFVGQSLQQASPGYALAG